MVTRPLVGVDVGGVEGDQQRESQHEHLDDAEHARELFQQLLGRLGSFRETSDGPNARSLKQRSLDGIQRLSRSRSAEMTLAKPSNPNHRAWRISR